MIVRGSEVLVQFERVQKVWDCLFPAIQNGQKESNMVLNDCGLRIESGSLFPRREGGLRIALFFQREAALFKLFRGRLSAKRRQDCVMQEDKQQNRVK